MALTTCWNFTSSSQNRGIFREVEYVSNKNSERPFPLSEESWIRSHWLKWPFMTNLWLMAWPFMTKMKRDLFRVANISNSLPQKAAEAKSLSSLKRIVGSLGIKGMMEYRKSAEKRCWSNRSANSWWTVEQRERTDGLTPDPNFYLQLLCSYCH